MKYIINWADNKFNLEMKKSVLITIFQEQWSPNPLPGKLPAPTSSNGNESLVNFESNEDYETSSKILPPVAVPLPEVTPAPLSNVSETQPLLVPGHPLQTFASIMPFS